MGYVVKMPKLGLEMEQGTLLEWHREEGTTVEAGETIAEVESEKSIGEVDAREDGVLRLVGLAEGETVPPGTPIGIVAGEDEDIADLQAEFETGGEESAEGAETEADGDETAEPAAESAGEQPHPEENVSGTEPSDVKASPRAERRADELGVDLTGVDGSGPQGAITAQDVENAAETLSKGTTPDAAESDTTGTGRVAGTAGGNYHTTTHVTHGGEADTLIETTEMAANAFDFDVSVTALLLLAVSATLDDQPKFNATFADDTHHLHEHQAIATATDAEGEIVGSVLSAVDERTFADLAKASRGRLEQATAGKRATFALASGEDCDDVRGVVTPPTVAGLVADCSYRRAIPAENGVEFRRYLRLSLAYDSRAVGDRDAEAFLETLLERIEELPELVLRTYR